MALRLSGGRPRRGCFIATFRDEFRDADDFVTITKSCSAAAALQSALKLLPSAFSPRARHSTAPVVGVADSCDCRRRSYNIRPRKMAHQPSWNFSVRSLSLGERGSLHLYPPLNCRNCNNCRNPNRVTVGGFVRFLHFLQVSNIFGFTCHRSRGRPPVSVLSRRSHPAATRRSSNSRVWSASRAPPRASRRTSFERDLRPAIGLDPPQHPPQMAMTISESDLTQGGACVGPEIVAHQPGGGDHARLGDFVGLHAGG